MCRFRLNLNRFFLLNKTVQTILLSRNPDTNDAKGVEECRDLVKIALKIIDKFFLTKVSWLSCCGAPVIY